MTRTSNAVVVGIGVATSICMFIAPDPVLLAATGGCLALIVGLLWTEDDVPIFLMPLAYQWTQVSIKPILTVIIASPLNQLSDFGAPLEESVYLSLCCISALACGIRWGLGSGKLLHRTQLLRIVSSWSTRRATIICVGLIGAGYVLNTTAYAIAPLRQPLLAFASVKLIGIFLLTLWSISMGRGRTVLAAVIAAEILLGVTGFFAGFRESLFVLFLGVISARPNLKPEAVAMAGLVFALTATVAIFWSSVKADYRTWVSEGGGQVVVRDIDERVAYIGGAAMNFDGEQFQKGLQALAARQSYIDFIAVVLLRVPDIIPHQEGRQLGEALYHIVTPRVLFPDKPPTPNDSDVTAFYTGLITNNDRNASISIGYVGELYIDFGMTGAVLIAGIMGVGVGWTTRSMTTRPGTNPLVRYALTLAVALPLTVFETALIKLIGSVVTALLAAWVMSILARSPKFRSYLTWKKRRVRVA